MLTTDKLFWFVSLDKQYLTYFQRMLWSLMQSSIPRINGQVSHNETYAVYQHQVLT